MCQKRGGLLWFAPASQFKLLTPEADVSTYTFNHHRVQHHFCKTCGIAPYSEGKMPNGAAMAAINVRCLDGIYLGSLKRKQVDGRSF